MKKSITLVVLSVISCLFITSCTNTKPKTKVPNAIKTITLMGKRGLHTFSYQGTNDPFLNSGIKLPEDYKGPKFELKHDYPKVAEAPNSDLPWIKALNGDTINQSNAMKYVEALKEHVSDDMEKLLYDYENWDSKKMPWWQSIWLGTVREPIHGMYVGSEFDAHTLAKQDLNLTTHVYTLFDQRASVVLNRIWGETRKEADNPKLSDANNAQYPEGSVIVKFAFVTASGEEWSPMEGTATWEIYSNVDPNTGSVNKEDTASFQTVYLMQFDIIVKDSIASPETGWVFSTLVYDKDAKGSNSWDRMIPLGATWGNNPNVIDTSKMALNSPVKVNLNLTENWINMNTPEYSRSTLGWDGRLSGPNDGAVLDNVKDEGGQEYAKLASVGCLGCHSTAQYKQKSFLVPFVDMPPKGIVYIPGSFGWMEYFQNRNGSTPKNAGPQQIGLDYGMVTSFKAIPLWEAAMADKETKPNN